MTPLLHMLLVPAVMSIGGITVPVDAVKAVPRVAIDIATRAPPKKLLNDTLPIIGSVASLAVPGAGIVIGAMVIADKFSHPMTPAEEKLWFDRMSIDRER